MNDEEEKRKLIESILENCDCVGNLEDQLLKLYCLFNCCMANYSKDGEDFLSRYYIKEKLGRVMGGIPIILDTKAKSQYATLMLAIPKAAEQKE